MLKQNNSSLNFNPDTYFQNISQLDVQRKLYENLCDV